jgi:hypothetical protein
MGALDSFGRPELGALGSHEGPGAKTDQKPVPMVGATVGAVVGGIGGFLIGRSRGVARGGAIIGVLGGIVVGHIADVS